MNYTNTIALSMEGIEVLLDALYHEEELLTMKCSDVETEDRLWYVRAYIQELRGIYKNMGGNLDDQTLN